MKRTDIFLVVLMQLFVGITIARAEPEKIILWEHLWGLSQKDSITLILDKSVRDYGPYELVKSVRMEQGRAIHSLKENELVNLLVFPTSQEREKELLPVYVYIKGALLGYRVCLIQKGTQNKFDTIKSLQDWHKKGMVMGTGTHWVDTTILESNHLRVNKNAKYELLYKMLASGRFECFPRGIDQIKRKMKTFGPEGMGLNIEVESSLLFHYPLREIPFVSQKNPRLKERILAGYLRAIQDGSWEEHVQEQIEKEGKREAYSYLNLKDRIFIPLENPYMSKEVMNMEVFEFDPLE